MYDSYEEVKKFFSSDIVLPGTDDGIIICFPMASFADVSLPEVDSDFRIGKYILTCVYSGKDYLVALLEK
jgi:hypothetical protein